MGSIAQDKKGDIALGFSASGVNEYPSLRYTGRAAGDPLGQMTQAEQTFFTGTGPQTEPEGRWGDYSALTVDPNDQCTFWYTNEYLESDTRRDRDVGDAHRRRSGSPAASSSLRSKRHGGASLRWPPWRVSLSFCSISTALSSTPARSSSRRCGTRRARCSDEEFSDDELMQAVGGPGLEAQMAAFAPEQVDELVRVYRAHNEPLHDELEACEGMEDVIVRLHEDGRGSASSPRSGARPSSSPSRGCASAICSRPSSAATRPRSTSRTRSRCCSRRSVSGVEPMDCAYVGDSPFDIRAAKAAHMYSVAVTWGRIHDREKLEAEEPAAIVDTAEELYESL